MDDVRKDERYALRLVETSEFLNGFAEELGREHRRRAASFVSRENTQKLRHGNTWNISPNDADRRDRFEPIETSNSISFSDIANNKVSALIEALSTTSEAMHGAFATRMYETIGAAAQSVANTVSAADHSDLLGAIYAALERIEFSVDREGVVKFPVMHASPEHLGRFRAAHSQMTVEENARFEGLIERKSAEALAAETRRRAMFVNYGAE